MRSDFNSATLLVSGSHRRITKLRYLPVAEGRFFTWEDDRAGGGWRFSAAMRGSSCLRPGRRWGRRYSLGGSLIQVIGVMEKKEQDFVTTGGM